jgi:quercetin dioxygenase-like cupin family protein
MGIASKEGLFALRLKLPKGYHIPPHTHPKPEVVTILSGTLRLGEGSTADQSKANPLPTGSFFVMSPGMQHYVYADEETVLQLNSNGPWGLTYVNEKDDPRKTQ